MVSRGAALLAAGSVLLLAGALWTGLLRSSALQDGTRVTGVERKVVGPALAPAPKPDASADFELIGRVEDAFRKKDFARALELLKGAKGADERTTVADRLRQLHAYSTLRAGDKDAARRIFTLLADTAASSTQAGDALLRISYMGLKDDSLTTRQKAALFAEVTRRFPESPAAREALLRHARLITSAPDMTEEEKRRAYERVVKNYPGSAEAVEAELSLATLNWRRTDLTVEDKRRAFERVTTEYPGTAEAAEAQFRVAALDWRRGENDQSLADKEQLAQRYQQLGRDAAAGADKGNAALHVAALQLEMERLRNASDPAHAINYDRVIELCDQALKTPGIRSSDAATAALIRAESQHFSANYESAQQEFKAVIDTFASDPECATPVNFAAYMQASNYMAMQEKEAALHWFDYVVQHSTEEANFHGNNIAANSLTWIAQLSIDAGDYARAETALNELERRYPSTPEAAQLHALRNLITIKRKDQ